MSEETERAMTAPWPKPDAYVTEVAEGRELMIEDEDDIGIALYLGPTLLAYGQACFAARMEQALCGQARDLLYSLANHTLSRNNLEQLAAEWVEAFDAIREDIP
jgi:hypothetical protein